MTRIVLGIEYDGSRHCGWQTQPSGCALQDALERALAEIAGQPVATVCAGRTDAGVHAAAQVVHFDAAVERPESAWVRGVNALLPAGMAVLWAREVAAEFHARYSARERRYRYLLLNHAVRPALAAGRIGWFHQPLDVEAMRAAARALVGLHDFSAFRSAECQASTPVRDLRAVTVERRGALVVFEFRANAFLHHMVRNLVGSLVYVGKGRHPPGWLAEVLAGRERARCAPTFDAAGLYLAGVAYEPHWGLPDESVRAAAQWETLATLAGSAAGGGIQP
jgi:tRNA pseudouridine38-40 synthase